jgi:hypothetical protein
MSTFERLPQILFQIAAVYEVGRLPPSSMLKPGKLRFRSVRKPLLELV